MLASRERAGGSAARTALLRRQDGASSEAATATGEPARGTVAGPASTPAPAVPEIKPASSGSTFTAPSTPPASATAPKAEEMDTLARLREAKRRARGG